MRPYRDEEAGLRARLEELDERARRRDERLGELRSKLEAAGWVPRAAAAWRKWILAAAVLVTGLLMVLGHLLVFQHLEEDVAPKAPPPRPAPDSLAELRSLQKQHRRLMSTLGALHGIHYKVHHGQWRLELGEGFLALDGEQAGEAAVLVAGWARLQVRRDLYNRIYTRLSNKQRASLEKLPAEGRP